MASVLRALEVATISLALGAPLIAQDSPAVKPTPSRPELHAYRVSRPPVIDGTLDDEAWTRPPIETTEWLSYNPLNGDRIPQQTHVWVAYDDNYFYFAFKCDDPEPARIKTSIARPAGEERAPVGIGESPGRLTKPGYTVETPLPLQSIRFTSGQNVRMGILF